MQRVAVSKPAPLPVSVAPELLAAPRAHANVLVIHARDFDRVQQQRSIVADVVDRLGRESAEAQGLRSRVGLHGGGDVAPVTSVAQLAGSDHTVLIWLDAGDTHGKPTEAIGLLKVGRKRLFLADERGRLRDCAPLCVLDFYVRAADQRRGVGIQLFNAMLDHMHAHAAALAYDRPSPLLTAFLRKHFGLARAVPQANHFCVFPDLFRHLDEGGWRQGPRGA